VTNERIIKLGMPLQIDCERKSKMNVIPLGIVKWRIGFAYKTTYKFNKDLRVSYQTGEMK